MKKIYALTLLFFLCTQFSFSQENYSHYKIIFTPNEVYSSAVIHFNFEKSEDIFYEVIDIQNYNQLVSSDIAKKEGEEVQKIDLSFLEKGFYKIRFFIKEELIQSYDFEKK